MAIHKTPQFNIKTGADSSCFFSREVTKSDASKFTDIEDKLGLIKDSEDDGGDIFVYPNLMRRTGDSIKGTTESIESQELRAGRTKSAPRKGNSSSEGSLDFEFSPETYDDILEAAFRNKWKPWVSDTNSNTNLEKDTFSDGYISCKVGNIKRANAQAKAKADGGTDAEVEAAGKEFLTALDKPQMKLLGKKDGDDALIITDRDMEVHELSCGNEDIRYAMFKKYGGVEGEDLWQEFQHLCVNTFSLSITPGQIVTGSFGFMGSNNPELLQLGYKNGAFEDKGIVQSMKERFLNKPYPEKGTKVEQDDWLENRRQWFGDFPQKGTSTDQFTAREGFLYINGKRVQFGSTLSIELNNGLSRIFAIHEKDAISMSPLTLDVTGSLGIYLIAGHAEELYNFRTNDDDVEVVDAFQDKEEDPETIYVTQIFKSKFTDADMGSGSESLEVTMPYQSFEEKAMRILRIRKRKPIAIEDRNYVGGDSKYGGIGVRLSSMPNDMEYMNNNDEYAESSCAAHKMIADGFTVTLKHKDGTTQKLSLSYIKRSFGNSDKPSDGAYYCVFNFPAVQTEDYSVTATYNGSTINKSFKVEPPTPVGP